MFKFFYLNNNVDTGVSVEIRPTLDDLRMNARNLQKAMIERFREYNGGELPRFRLVPPNAS